ncbi:MAG: hypothetical protein ACYC3X_31225 [Pirellulaceae bacterium]
MTETTVELHVSVRRDRERLATPMSDEDRQRWEKFLEAQRPRRVIADNWESEP